MGESPSTAGGSAVGSASASTPHESKFLRMLAKTVRRLNASEPPAESELLELISSLVDGAVSSDSLSGEMLRKIPIGYFPLGRHPEAEQWDYGLPKPRSDLIRLLRRRALNLSDESAARLTARAAVRLAQLEGFQLGPARLHRLLSDAAIVPLTGWPASDVERTLGWADGEQRLTGRLYVAALEAAKPLDRLVSGAAEGWSREDATLFSAAVDVMAELPPRPDVQWQVIHFTWKMLNLAQNQSAADAAALMREKLATLESRWTQAHARRWVTEARRQLLESKYCWSGIAIGDPLRFRPAPD